MKTGLLAVTALVACFAAADDLSNGVPDCGKPCVQAFTSGSEIAGCRQLDIKCVCKNTDFLDQTACCLKDKCDKAGQDAAVAYAQKICSSENVEVPKAVVCKKDASGTTTTEPTATATETDDAASTLSGTGGILAAVAAMLFAL